MDMPIRKPKRAIKPKTKIRMQPKSQTLGSYLLITCRNRGWTQKELCELLEMSTSHLAKIIRGTTSPGLDRFFKICEALNEKPERVIKYIRTD